MATVVCCWKCRCNHLNRADDSFTNEYKEAFRTLGNDDSKRRSILNSILLSTRKPSPSALKNVEP